MSGSSTQTSIYLQIANVLRAQIVNDAQPHRHRLPSEQDLAKIHGVARGTIRCALEVLAEEGLIARTPGQPTVTIPDGIRAYQQLRHRRAIVVLAAEWTEAEIPTGYFGQIYQGILAASEEAGYRCTLRWVEGKLKPIDVKPWMEDPREILGVINVHVLDRGLQARYIETGVPVVCVDFWPVCPGVDGVVVDCFAEAHQAVDFLLANNHREIFYVGNLVGTGPKRQPEMDALFMESGYRRATRSVNATASAGRVYYCRYDEPDDLVKWFLQLDPRPTAGIIFSSELLETFIAGLGRRGIRCPEDVSLLCKSHDGQVVKAASVCTHALALGRFAAKLLLGRVSGLYPAGMRVAFESRLNAGPTVRALVQ